jgi:RNA polymerase sigma-70 factor (ECF subfamily)
MLRSRKSRREDPMGVVMPDTIGGIEGEGDPEKETLLADSIGQALLVVLETLKPAERITFVLHDIFAMTFEEIASVLGRSPAATRQLASRARRRVQGSGAQPDVDLASQRRLVDAFLAAARTGNFNALLAVLDPDVVLRDDREAKAAGAAKEVRGAQAVAGHLVLGRANGARPALVGDAVGVVVAPPGQPGFVVIVSFRNDRIAGFDLISSPERLDGLRWSLLGDS